MKLAVGTRLGPYEIQHAIGAGGMGIVYRADDSRLGRKVAIKILPTAHGEHLKRFEREARAIGGLNHPNLLTLYDIGEFEGTPYLVTELLDGESLRLKLQRGRMRLREAIQIAAEVSRGLAAAHEAGVVHRDIKPDNIFITGEGRVKILDFGIVKLTRTDEPDPTAASDIGRDATMTPTATTDTGMMIGTPGYMAPEQLDGDKIDERTDIFALGVVLYEMISGVRAFAADSPIEESYAILKNTPVPPAGATKSVARVVLRCLEKRPEARFQSATDLAFALDELDASTDPVARISASDLETAPQPRPDISGIRVAKSKRQVLIGVLAGAAVAAGIVGFLAGRATTRAASTLSQRWPSVVEGGPKYNRVTYHSQTHWHARLSPDGKSAIYSTYRDGSFQIMRSQVEQPSMTPLGVAGRLLDVSARGELAIVNEVVPDDGGTLSRLFEGAGPRGITDHVTAATWLPDGETLAIIRDHTALEFPIGTVIAQRPTGKLDMLRASPAGDRFAFVDHPAPRDSLGTVVIVDRTGKRIAESSEQSGVEGLAWSPDGSEVWFSNADEIQALTTAKRQHVVLRGSIGRLVLVDVRAGRVLVAPSDVRLKMFTGPRSGPFREVGWFDSSEVESVSTDGSSIAFVEAAGTGLTSEGASQYLRRSDGPPALVAQGYRATLLPDASAMIMISGARKLMRVPTGAGTPTQIAIAPIAELDISDLPSVSWNGRYLVVRGAVSGAKMQLWRFDLTQPGPPRQLDVAHDGGRHPLSPDGERVAISGAAGGVEVVSIGGGPRVVIEGLPGEQPLSFTGDGSALFVMHSNGETIEISRIDLATNTRSGWARISPEQRPVYYSVALDASGEVITYSTNSDSSDLYVLTPPKVN